MPSLSLNQPLVSAGASAANDWADASADTQITVAAGVSLKRGACAEVDIGALATADAGLQKFIRLEARGNAFAEARASVQLQFTLNAFEKLGFTIGAQAKAQAAAGLEVGLGISVGDFIQILKENTDARGLPFDLAMVLLEEVSIQAGVRVHVAASAAAYAELSGTLNLVARAGTKPGFFFRTKAGLGLAAGVGFGASFGCGFQDPGRCYGRVVDRLVNAVGDAVDAHVAGSSREMRDLASTLRPVARIALRHAWELGHFLAERGASGSGISSSELSEKAVQVVVEECREFLFGAFVGHSVESLREVLSGNAAGFTDIVWKRIAPQRQAMAAALRAAPEEPFVFSAENVAYWSDLASKAADLVTAIPTVSRREDFIRAASLLYAASRLLLRISESRVVRTSAYAQAIGAGRTSTPTLGIAGRIDPQPAPAICAHINAVLNRSATTKLGYEDLIPFLTQDAVLDPLRRRFPQVDAFLKVFNGTLGTVENALFRELVAVPDFRGPRSAQAFLRILVQALDAHLETHVLGQLGPEVNRRTADPNVRLYFNEVILGTLRFTKDLTLRTVLDWDAHPPNRDDFLEILSSVALMPVTRSAVVLFDGLLTAVQRNLKASFLHASTTLTGPKGPFRVLGLSPDPALLALVKTVVASGGEIFGPLPDETRTRLRHALYEVMELLPPGSATSFQRQLEDDFFIPNLEALSSLKDELLAISQVRFGKFVETMVDAGGAAAAALIEAACAAAVQQLDAWETALNQELQDLEKEITRWVTEVDRQVRDVEESAQRALSEFGKLCSSLEGRAARRRLQDAFARELSSLAIAELRRNPLYPPLPAGVRAAARQAVRDAVGSAVHAPFVDPVLEAVGNLAASSEALLQDIRSLNPNRPLGAQILELVLDAIEDRLAGGNPRIEVAVDFRFDFFGPQRIHFALGTLELPLRPYFNLVRSALRGIPGIQAQTESMAREWSAWIAGIGALETSRAQLERARKDQEHQRSVRAEQVVSEKTVTILHPQPQSVHDHQIAARIVLGGVPLSYLGRNPKEPRRVLVFLNGELLPAESLLPSANTTVAPETGTLAGAGRGSIGGRAFARPGSGLGVITRRVGDGGSSRKSQITVSEFIATPPGRRATPSTVARWEQQVQAEAGGLTVRLDLREADLAPGANALTVLVLDPGGKRHQQTVNFVYFPDATPSVATPPGRPTPALLPGGAPPGGSRRPQARTQPGWMFRSQELDVRGAANVAAVRAIGGGR